MDSSRREPAVWETRGEAVGGEERGGGTRRSGQYSRREGPFTSLIAPLGGDRCWSRAMVRHRPAGGRKIAGKNPSPPESAVPLSYARRRSAYSNRWADGRAVRRKTIQPSFLSIFCVEPVRRRPGRKGNPRPPVAAFTRESFSILARLCSLALPFPPPCPPATLPPDASAHAQKPCIVLSISDTAAQVRSRYCTQQETRPCPARLHYRLSPSYTPSLSLLSLFLFLFFPRTHTY